jgi:hypothetical protein
LSIPNNNNILSAHFRSLLLFPEGKKRFFKNFFWSAWLLLFPEGELQGIKTLQTWLLFLLEETKGWVLCTCNFSC